MGVSHSDRRTRNVKHPEFLEEFYTLNSYPASCMIFQSFSTHSCRWKLSELKPNSVLCINKDLGNTWNFQGIKLPCEWEEDCILFSL